MSGAFGRGDWVVNSVLFGAYHLHEPWVIPNAVVTGFLCAGPSITRKNTASTEWMAIPSPGRSGLTDRRGVAANALRRRRRRG